MKFREKISNRMSKLSDSVVSILIEEIKPSNLISFAGGSPASKMLPIKMITEANEWSMSKLPLEALQYGDPAGYLPLRELLAKSNNCSTEQIFISSGSQQSLDYLARLFLSASDKVGVFSPTYMGLFRACNPSMVEYIDLGYIAEKLDFDQIEEAFKLGLKAIYVIPNYDNPTGRTISLEDRIKLSALAMRYQVIIIEDDAYHDITFAGEVPPSFFSICPENTIYLRTFSKVIAPGLRIGWVAANKVVIEYLTKMKLANDFHASTLSQLIAYNILAINKKSYELHIENLCEYYRKQLLNIEEALNHELSNFATWTIPKGGIFVWLTFNFPIDTTRLLRACIRKGISYVPGEMFFPDSIATNKLRLCFSSASKSEMFAGMRCLREQLEIELAKQDCREAIAV